MLIVQLPFCLAMLGDFIFCFILTVTNFADSQPTPRQRYEIPEVDMSGSYEFLINNIGNNVTKISLDRQPNLSSKLLAFEERKIVALLEYKRILRTYTFSSSTSDAFVTTLNHNVNVDVLDMFSLLTIGSTRQLAVVSQDCLSLVGETNLRKLAGDCLRNEDFNERFPVVADFVLNVDESHLEFKLPHPVFLHRITYVQTYNFPFFYPLRENAVRLKDHSFTKLYYKSQSLNMSAVWTRVEEGSIFSPGGRLHVEIEVDNSFRCMELNHLRLTIRNQTFTYSNLAVHGYRTIRGDGRDVAAGAKILQSSTYRPFSESVTRIGYSSTSIRTNCDSGEWVRIDLQDFFKIIKVQLHTPSFRLADSHAYITCNGTDPFAGGLLNPATIGEHALTVTPGNQQFDKIFVRYRLNRARTEIEKGIWNGSDVSGDNIEGNSLLITSLNGNGVFLHSVSVIGDAILPYLYDKDWRTNFSLTSDLCYHQSKTIFLANQSSGHLELLNFRSNIREVVADVAIGRAATTNLHCLEDRVVLFVTLSSTIKYEIQVSSTGMVGGVVQSAWPAVVISTHLLGNTYVYINSNRNLLFGDGIHNSSIYLTDVEDILLVKKEGTLPGNISYIIDIGADPSVSLIKSKEWPPPPPVENLTEINLLLSWNTPKLSSHSLKFYKLDCLPLCSQKEPSKNYDNINSFLTVSVDDLSVIINLKDVLTEDVRYREIVVKACSTAPTPVCIPSDTIENVQWKVERERICAGCHCYTIYPAPVTYQAMENIVEAGVGENTRLLKSGEANRVLFVYQTYFKNDSLSYWVFNSGGAADASSDYKWVYNFAANRFYRTNGLYHPFIMVSNFEGEVGEYSWSSWQRISAEGQCPRITERGCLLINLPMCQPRDACPHSPVSTGRENFAADGRHVLTEECCTIDKIPKNTDYFVDPVELVPSDNQTIHLQCSNNARSATGQSDVTLTCGLCGSSPCWKKDGVECRNCFSSICNRVTSCGNYSPGRELMVVEDAREDTDTYQYGDVLKLSCKNGFSLANHNPFSYFLHCNSRGQWGGKLDADQPVCTFTDKVKWTVLSNRCYANPYILATYDEAGRKCASIHNESTIATLSGPLLLRLLASLSIDTSLLKSYYTEVWINRGTPADHFGCEAWRYVHSRWAKFVTKACNQKSNVICSADIYRPFGEWMEYGEWSDCDPNTRSKRRSRTCDYPTCGRRQCNGEAVEEISCCPPPLAKKHSSFQVTGHNVGSTIQYSCEEGYITRDNTEGVCKSDAEWSIPPPRCAGVECPDLTDGQFSKVSSFAIRSRTRHVYGDEAIYRCGEGFYLAATGKQSVKVVCGLNRQWSEHVPIKCQARPCPQAHVQERANLTVKVYDKVDGIYREPFPLWRGSLRISYKDVLTYTCHRGYEVSPFTNTISFVCLANGSYSTQHDAMNCKKITCRDVPLESLNVVITEDMLPVEWENWIQVACKPGYLLRDNSNLQNVSCTLQRIWTPPLQPCIPVSCGHPGNLTGSGTQQIDGYLFLDEANYACKYGYHDKNTTAVATRLACGINGRWNGLPPDCIEINCGDPGEGVNAIKSGNSSKYLDVVEYECFKGYSATGVSTELSIYSGKAVCRESGVWDGTTNMQCSLEQAFADLQVEVVDVNKVKVRFIQTVTFSGLKVIYYLNFSGQNTFSEKERVYSNHTHSQSGEVKVNVNLNPGFVYRLEVTSEYNNQAHVLQADGVVTFNLPAGSPQLKDGIAANYSIPEIITTNLISRSSHSLDAVIADVHSEKAGRIRNYSLIVCELNPFTDNSFYNSKLEKELPSHNEARQSILVNRLGVWPPYESFAPCHLFEEPEECQAEVKSYQNLSLDDAGDLKAVRRVLVTIGHSTECWRTSKKCNGILRQGKLYCVKLRTYTADDWTDSFCSPVVQTAKTLEWATELVLPLILSLIPFVTFISLVAYLITHNEELKSASQSSKFSQNSKNLSVQATKIAKQFPSMPSPAHYFPRIQNAERFTTVKRRKGIFRRDDGEGDMPAYKTATDEIPKVHQTPKKDNLRIPSLEMFGERPRLSSEKNRFEGRLSLAPQDAELIPKQLPGRLSIPEEQKTLERLTGTSPDRKKNKMSLTQLEAKVIPRQISSQWSIPLERKSSEKLTERVEVNPNKRSVSFFLQDTDYLARTASRRLSAQEPRKRKVQRKKRRTDYPSVKFQKVVSESPQTTGANGQPADRSLSLKSTKLTVHGWRRRKPANTDSSSSEMRSETTIYEKDFSFYA